MAEATLTTTMREAIPDLPPAFRADRTLLALDLGTTDRLGAARRRRPDHQRHRVVPPRPFRWRRHAVPAVHQLAHRARPAERTDRGHLVRGSPAACWH